MSSTDSIFSLRIVIAEFYMEKPVPGLDACYSEFRGKEIKRVPVIRIFGSNAQGQKTCMHVHGVFPYFYIPYDQKDFESLNQAIYQVAINIDKAINISLSQGSSTAQHVFKVQLVKGIPFYGYHRTDHQFLKIYMFNPRFVRRAANLLQNGAILNKNFHPHESHVPYILQFMIDYNLYGMSFLHVPLEIVKFRRSETSCVVPFKNIQEIQILDCNLVKKVSCSSLEVDIGSNFILNRFQLIAKTNATHTNPGIESIWNDERLRREKLAESIQDDEEKLNAIPPLEIPFTQERPNAQPTESETFYRTGLLNKLLAMETSMLDSTQISNQSHNSSNISNSILNPSNISLKKQHKRTFNLTKLLQNFVYPEECTQSDHLINASFIPNHLSNNSIFEQSLSAGSNQNKQQQNIEDESIFLDDTLVDEELVLSLTQSHHHKTDNVPFNATLREEDMELLDILQQLEENNDDKIDLDSSLAPLSQNHKNFGLSPEELDKKTTAAAMQDPIVDSASENEDESDENLLDFSIAFENVDDLILKLTQSHQEPHLSNQKSSINVPQVDGADDVLKTPTKSSRTVMKPSPPRTPTTPRGISLIKTSPRRSPKTPKTGHKFAQLPLVSINRSSSKSTTIANSSNETTPVKRGAMDRKSLPTFSLAKNLALLELRRKSISTDTNVAVQATSSAERKSLNRRCSKRFVDLDKTHVTCALTPRKSSEKMLKVYTLEKHTKDVNENNEALTTEIVKENYIIEDPIKRKQEKHEKQKVFRASEKKEHLCPTDEKIELQKEFDVISKKTAENNTEIKPKVSSNSESDAEAIESDNEASVSLKIFRRTPNSKRIKRSITATNPAKRSRTSSNLNSTVKFSKLKCESENEIEKKNNVTMKKCQVKLKRIDKAVNNEDSIKDKLITFKNDFDTHLQSIQNAAVENVKQTSSADVLGQECCYKEINSPRQNEHLYNKSLNLQSPLLFSQNSSPAVLSNSPTSINSLQSACHITLHSFNSNSIVAPDTKLVLTPLDLPPSREEVLQGCCKLQLPKYEFQQPFYSNPDDITKHKELGFTVLQIPGNKLNDLEEFQSILGEDIKGLTAWRREQLMRLGGMEMLNKYRNTQRIREYFSNQKSVIITPQFKAPTRQDVKLWLKARELLKNQGEDLEELKMKNIDEDSPIKVRRQKVTMMLNTGDENDDSDDADNSLDCSSRSITLTPATPVQKLRNIKEMSDQSLTPVSRNLESIYTKNKMTIKKRSNCKVLRRISLNKQLKEVCIKQATPYNSKKSPEEAAATTKDSQESVKVEAQTTEIAKLTQESIVSNSQNSETSISSEIALAELEKSSFMRNLRESDTTIGGCTDNSTLNLTFGFKVALENLQQAKADVEFNYLTIATLEVFVATREDLYPNPELDEIRCLFYAIENSIPSDHIDVGEKLPRKACGYIMVQDYRDTVPKEGRIHGIDRDIEVTIVQTEVEALEALLRLCSRWDPDIYAGYEIEMSSWGFVIERSKYLCLNIAPLLSRVPTQKVRDFVDEDRESFTDLDVERKLCGRILLDVWRLLRSEIALTSYTFENVMYHIMHKRCPWHSYRSLTEWFVAPCSRWIVIEYYLERVRGTLALLDQLDLLGRTSEMAKLIGIQFYEVLSRGSQFRVESMMLRIAKPKNLVPLSPSVQQRAHMRAPEYLALIMEPQSRFYADPLIVLDFQSLYPSMIIAYNYCFSTCLGRVEHLGQTTPFEFGASQLRVSPTMLRKLIDRDLINISPCGVVFVKSAVREGILPRMLTEILDTRQMVKQSMKLDKSNSALQRILHSRQLGLKLMANVTYGYTAANFSGRMPAVEVGDSVVSKGRETLERSIKMVEANDKWNVRVVYGDTDSMFVLVPGRDRVEAFRIGEEIAEAVTKQNPHPVKLKLEKVYQPCVLQTKKRYVGYMYETVDQKEPVYEAKGIETVRRDGCPMVAKMLEKVLRLLFETADVSQVKQYVCRQFTKLLSGRANIQDLIFAKEFRGLNGYRPTACVPALELTRKWIQTDPRRIPRRGERVPFIITNGPPGVPLIRLVRHPHEVIADEGLKINSIYYITKAIIPPLNRCLLLIGADVNEWFANLPRKLLLTPALSTANEIISYPNAKSKKSTISQFFSTTNCITDCGRQTKDGICSDCSQNSTRSVIILQSKISKIERSYLTTQHICQACCGRVGDLRCGSLDCPVLYVLEVKRRDLQQVMHYRNIVDERF